MPETAMTLYDELRYVEDDPFREKEKAEKLIGEWCARLERHHAGKEAQLIKHTQSFLSIYDVSEIQWEILQKYKTNPVLARAMRREETVLHTVERLQPHGRQWLPRKRDDEHNTEVTGLSSLIRIDNPPFRRNGFFVPDNPISSGLWTGCIGLPLGAVVEYFCRDYVTEPSIFTEQGAFTVGVGVLFTITGLGMGTLMAASHFDRAVTLDQAKYIDEKLDKFL